MLDVESLTPSDPHAYHRASFGIEIYSIGTYKATIGNTSRGNKRIGMHLFKDLSKPA
jgi:hypothetical protein